MAAGINIFTLMGSIMVDNQKANESISKTEQKAEGLASKLGAGIGTAAKWGAAIGGAAIVAGGALFGVASKASDAGDRVDKLSQKIGISKESFQEYDYILGQNGADVEKLQVGMKTLIGRMEESTKGTGTGAEAFKRLKLDAIDPLTGSLKTQEQMFEETAKALMGMPEGAEKSKLAFDLFGKAGAELMPMLNAGADSFDELKQKAHDLGFVMDGESVAAAAQFNDSMDDVKKALGGAITKIGIGLMPMFQSMMDWVLLHMPEIQEVIRVVFEKIGQFVNIAIDIFGKYLIPIMQSVFDWTKENWPTIQTIIEGVFKAIKFVWDNVLGPVLGFLWDAIKIVVDFISDNFPAMQKTVETIFQGIGKTVKAVTDIFKGTIDAIKLAYDWLTKWNGTEAKGKSLSGAGNNMAINFDGTHASGLAYVPYDGYVAQVHRGEEIIRAQDKQSIVELVKALTLSNTQSSQKVELVVNLDGQQLARGIYDPFQNETRLRGTNLVGV